jgi:hypothetical protein
MIIDLTRREYEIATAYDVGLDVPRIKFKNMDVDYPYTIDGNLTIEKIDGVDVSFSAFWNNGFSFWTTIINDKFLLSGKQGPELTANCVTVFPAKSKKMESVFNKLINKFSDENYIGFITVDVIIKEPHIYYDRIHFNICADYFMGIVELSDMDAETLITCIESGEHIEKPQGYSCTLRLWDYPYCPERNKFKALKYAEDLKEIDECYIATARGNTIKHTWKNLYKNIADMDLCYRIDGDYKARWTFNQLKRAKIL